MGTLRKAWTALVVLFVLAFVVVGGAVASGYILVGEPAAAASQVASGNVTAPEVGLVEDETRISDVSTSHVVVDFTLFADNTANHVGGSLDSVDYEVYWSEWPDGNFTKLGDGSLSNLRVPPEERVTHETSMRTESSEAARAGGVYLTRGSIYVKIQGNARIAFGPFSFSVPFEQVKEMER